MVGKIGIYRYEVMYYWVSPAILPQLGRGSGMPIPMKLSAASVKMA